MNRARVSQVQIDFDSVPVRVNAVVFTPDLNGGAEAEAGRALSAGLGRPVEVAIEQVRIGGADAEAAQLANARGAEPDRTADRVAERLALLAGVARDQVLVDRERRIARVRAETLPGATLRAYRLLETRAGAGEPDWTILLIPPPLSLPDMPSFSDPPSPEAEAVLATVVWAHRRLAMPIDVSGAEAEEIAERLRASDVDARVVAPATGPTRFAWHPPGR